MKESRRDNRRGSALIFVVILLTVLGLGVTATYRYMMMSDQHARRLARNAEAAYLAEAGLEKAIAALREDPGAYRGEEKTPLGDGRFSVSVNADTMPGQYTLQATGETLDEDKVLARARLRADLRLSIDRKVLAYNWQKVPE
jgi:hypothetical protein